jgi:hypothetical protein
MKTHSGRDQLAEGWRMARNLLRVLVRAWGAPAELHARATISPIERSQILMWLRPIEALARRLLFIMAAALPAPIEIACKPRREDNGRSHGHGRANLWSNVSSAWGVSFVLAPRASTGGRRCKTLPKTTADPRPLAERIEAVSRVLADPAPYAARLARLLHRRGAAAAFDFVMRPCRNGARTNPLHAILERTTAQAASLISRFAADTS